MGDKSEHPYQKEQQNILQVKRKTAKPEG